MEILHGLTKKLSVLLVCDVVAFASLGVVVLVAFAEGRLALAAATAVGLSAVVGLSWWLGEAFARLVHHRATNHDATGNVLPTKPHEPMV